MRNEIILMTGCEPWEHWRQTHNIAHIWAHENKVIFIDTDVRYEYMRREKGLFYYLKCFWNQEIKWVAENIAVLQAPPMLPVAVSILSRFWEKQIHNISIKLSKIIQAKILLRKIKMLGLSPTVLSIWRPLDLMLARRMGERVACWHLFDDVSLYPGNERISSFIEKVERKNIKRVQLVFAVSQKLYENKNNLHSNVHLIPNAGDFKIFNAALTDNLPEPEDLKGVPRPRVVFTGGLGWETDYNLLGYIADSHPEWSVVMIGIIRSSGKEGVKSVTKRPNAFYLGYKPQPELPAYLKYSDAGLMPYRIVGSVVYASPLKIHEYLAAGLPVVSTPQPAILPFSNIVGVADNEEDYVSLIEEALANNSPDKVAERVALARENSWEKRVEDMNCLINPFLNGK